MFRVKLDDYILYDYRLDDLKHEDMIISNTKLSLEANKTNSFQFNILSNHRYFDKIKKLKSIVKVYYQNELLFRGRVLEDTQVFNKSKSVDCEGELAFLLDSIYRPYDLTGRKVSLKTFVTDLLNNHNSQVKPFQRFKIGVIEVADPNEKVNFSCESDTKTWKIFEEKIIPTYGGYIVITYDEDEMPIFNYYKEPPYMSDVNIEYGVNLLDISNLISAEDLFTACIPRGAKLKDETGNEISTRLDISSVNNGIDYLIDEDKAQEFGIIYANSDIVTFDNVTIASNLLNKAQALLSEGIKLSQTLEIKANYLTIKEEIKKFRFLHYVYVISHKHGINEKYLLEKLDLDLFNIGNTQITLGEVKKTLTDNSLTNKSMASKIVKTVEKIDSNYSTMDNVDKKVVAVTEKYKILNNSLNGDNWNIANILGQFVEYEENNVCYKKSGNVVSIIGSISPVSDIENSEEEITIFNLPKNYRPHQGLSFICLGDNYWLLMVKTDGDITFSKYGLSESATCKIGDILQINVTFLV